MDILKTISKSRLQSIFDSSDSYKSILHTLGIAPSMYENNKLRTKICEFQIDLRKYKSNKNKNVIEFLKQKQNVLVSESQYNRRFVKKYLIECGLKDYVCSECSNTGTHNNKQLVLQLDHINGINDDNRVENLRFLCPNCHSQTDTFAGRNIKTKTSTVSKVKTITPKCRKITLSKDEVLEMKKTKSNVEIAKILKVSETAIRKFLK